MSKYSIVIPVKRYTYFWSPKGRIDERKNTKQHDNVKRFFEISWKTHDKNLKKKDIDCIYFIVPQNEKPYFQSQLSKHIKNVKTMVITDDDLIPTTYNFSSHRKQMLLKLLISKYIQTDLYLILDDDIISLKPFGYKDLFFKNKVRYADEPDINSQAYVWECSRDLLKLEKTTNIYRLKNTMSITPEILIKPVVENMMKYLIKKHDNIHNLYDIMTRVSWTEYTLYWLYLRYVDKRGTKYYYKPSKLTSENLTVYYDNYTELLRKIIKERRNHFAIIQSNVYEYKIKNLKALLIL
jgi:hypothetical protein